ncbi:RimJ/RimL family protein N-acetyltransferase [Paenibacillus anaericanus]|uniref:GNAT family N-acetyltransferase n=1 Tax=Paenibacillus anaericanus TaxID=170367 RepID=UPI00278029F1|nr:GNAT family N-acetyltransferase [Paenibacillus anaericanus]MDQ0088566.1 RimJ/RimL family protein N-acetyltransferase [Paenibacillus anaericanus]
MKKLPTIHLERLIFELAIVHKEEKYFIGAISMGCNKKFDHGELAYWIGRKYKNNGYCTEAAKGIVRYAFGEMNLNRVFARHLGKNPASGAVIRSFTTSYYSNLLHNIIA